MRRFNPRELQDYLASADPKPLLLDVREPWEFGICHLEGSRLLSMREIPRRLQDLDPQQETVVICHHGVRSLQVAHFLEHAGFTRLINLDGGVAAWARDVDPTLPTY